MKKNKVEKIQKVSKNIEGEENIVITKIIIVNL